MKAKSILATLLLLVAGLQTATAQYDMKVWKNGSFTQFFVNEVDSVTYSEIITVTDIILSNESICLKVGGKMWQLYATIMPENAEVKNLSWESSDESVATVDATGLVTAVKSGTCIITCRATDGSGVFAECQVNVIQDKSGSIDGRYYVDLGLPSGTLWATTNVGANVPEDYGDYFSWGETTPRDNYSWSTYTHCDGTAFGMNKYCAQSEYGSSGFTDELTELLPEDDAVTVNWGEQWQMPSREQIEELCNSAYTTTEWTTLNGVTGMQVTSIINGKSIFLPAGGDHSQTTYELEGEHGYFWSRTLDTYQSNFGFYLDVNASKVTSSSYYRYFGQSVRPVRVKD
ncbi:MAG: Ig-like domain-containing protein [Bacteroidaceae bacterium]|nr:Ig-like domain-containing protein [Bacteroidaceae bacterium]